MRQYLLDTNVCVFLLRGQYDIDKKLDGVGLENCYISEITEAELKYGAELGRRKGLKHRIEQLREFLSSIQVLPIHDAIDLYASEKARLRLAGTPIDDDFDLLIGCTAIANDLVMVTENLKHFKSFSGIQLENWVER